MKISILGLGYYGLPLALKLKDQGHKVSGSVSSLEKKNQLSKSSPDLKIELMKFPEIPSTDLLDAEIVILNIPPFIGQLEWFKSWPWQKKSWLIFISSTSALKAEGNGPNLRAQEEWIKKEFIQHNILRFAGLIGGNRHPGKTLSGRLGIKGRLWPVNLIHLDDTIGFTKALIEQKKTNQTFNVVSDEHHSKEEFYSEYAQRLGLPLPQFDQADHSKGEAISNEKIKKIYQLKWPTMLGKSL
jgi:nucleoside-diphosphate-sugar epimerase